MGGHVDDDDEAHIAQQGEEAAFIPDRIYDWRVVKRMLTRDEEVGDARQPGRPSDASKRMRDYEALFCPVFQSMGDSRTLVESKNVQVSNCTELLLVQQARAERLRKDEEGGAHGDVVPREQLVEESRASKPEASIVSLEEIQQGPGKVARKLAKDAKLNDDLLRPVALVADKTQQKWKACMRSAPELSDPSNE